ncbi:MAG TPA: lasso peptide biosynthesis B2 protein [Chthoniobacterales bacterium]|nr:lasso peptide biosynthesis B2 protein [Chthoniobacterales bacterium]
MTIFETSHCNPRERQDSPRDSEENGCQIWRTCSHLRSIVDPDGGLVLDLSTGRFHSLNRTSAVVWKALRDNPEGADSNELLRAMTAAFGPNPGMGDDLHGLLQAFEHKGLVQRYPANDGTLDSFPRTPEIREKSMEKDGAVANPLQMPPKTEFDRAGSQVWWTSAAWLGFLVVNLILWMGGFPRLHQALSWLSATRRIGEPSQKKISTICGAVNRAAALYLRKSWCLQRAAVTFSLLRLAGMPAEFVIGCRRLPFYCHAWIEVHRFVVNDNARVKGLYPELDRF